jgi:hypothetical protein
VNIRLANGYENQQREGCTVHIYTYLDRQPDNRKNYIPDIYRFTDRQEAKERERQRYRYKDREIRYIR